MANKEAKVNRDMKKILALYEAGQVQRCHTVPHHGEYSVGQHCYGMAALAKVLITDPAERAIIYDAIIAHDFAERWTGDPPAPLKWCFPEAKATYEKANNETHAIFEVSRPTLDDLSEEQLKWLRCLDIAELYLWCGAQLRLGNTNVAQMMRTCKEWVHRQSLMPIRFMDWWRALLIYQHDLPRLSDIPWSR